MNLCLFHIFNIAFLFPHLRKAESQTKSIQRKATIMTSATEQLPHMERLSCVPLIWKGVILLEVGH